jgi:hypothetical protein
MTDASVDDPARGEGARCAPLVAAQPVFPGPGGHGLTARLRKKNRSKPPTRHGEEAAACGAGEMRWTWGGLATKFWSHRSSALRKQATTCA